MEKNQLSEVQPELIQNISWGHIRSQLLSTAVELDVFSAIHEGYADIEKLARCIKAPLRSVRILLDALVATGLLNKSKFKYSLGSEAKTFLVRGEPRYLGPLLKLDEAWLNRWSYLTRVVMTGKPNGDHAKQENKELYFKELVRKLFPASFSSAGILCRKMGVGKSLTGLKVLDIGCGSAAWSLAFAILDPNIQVVALDYPQVLEVAQGYIQRFRVQKQYELREGSYHDLAFENDKYDVVILGHILHMESESQVKKLLKKCFAALKPDGRLVIAEMLTNDAKTGPEMPVLFGLHMLMFTEQGDVYSDKDLKKWIRLAGFKKVSQFSVQLPTSILIASK